MPTSTPPIAAMASTPRSGREPCAATPSVSTSSHRKPLWAMQMSRPVGSVTTAASAHTSAATASAPMLANSSSYRRHDDVAAQVHPDGPRTGQHDRGQAALHVESAAPVQAVVLDP